MDTVYHCIVSIGIILKTHIPNQRPFKSKLMMDKIGNNPMFPPESVHCPRNKKVKRESIDLHTPYPNVDVCLVGYQFYFLYITTSFLLEFYVSSIYWRANNIAQRKGRSSTGKNSPSISCRFGRILNCNRIEIESSKTDIHLGCRLKGEGSNFFVVLQGFDSEDFFQRLLLFLVMVVADRFRRCTGSTKIVVYIVVVVVVVAVQHTIIREL